MDVGVVGVAGSDRPVVVVANHVGAVVDESDDPDDWRKLHVFAVEHDPQAVYAAGIEYATRQCQDLLFHGVEGIPMFTAGRAGGLPKTGIHVAGKGQPGTRLGYTALRAMGLETKEWATDSNRTSKDISEIMA